MTARVYDFPPGGRHNSGAPLTPEGQFELLKRSLEVVDSLEALPRGVTQQERRELLIQMTAAQAVEILCAASETDVHARPEYFRVVAMKAREGSVVSQMVLKGLTELSGRADPRPAPAADVVELRPAEDTRED